MKILVYLLVLPLLLSTSLKEEPVKWVVQKSSKVQVKGKTNISRFTCGIVQYAACDTLTLTTHPSMQQNLLLQGTIYLDVMQFDCMNKIMTEELRKTMKAVTHPRLKISFVTLGKVSIAKNQQASTCGVVDIEIAGVRKRFSIDYTYTTGNNACLITLAGRKAISFSDFCLTPPKKLNGMVQAKDELDIEFHLVMRKI